MLRKIYSGVLGHARRLFGYETAHRCGDGVIETGGDRDWFAVELAAGSTYLIGAAVGEGTYTRSVEEVM